jgi:hypothetical protein
MYFKYPRLLAAAHVAEATDLRFTPSPELAAGLHSLIPAWHEGFHPRRDFPVTLRYFRGPSLVVAL